MLSETEKPWPADAIVIVAALAGQERREQMDSVHEAACLDCGALVHYDGYTAERARAFPLKISRGRPIKFLCVTCFPKYDFLAVTYFEDHRNHKKLAVTAGKLP